ncbi:MAG: hypothetical protein WC584_02440 [Candidatus Pacearchaeota archaeon]
MLERKLDKKYEGPARYCGPGDIGSEDSFSNISGPKFLLGVGIGLICVGAYVVYDKTRDLCQTIFRR